MNIDVEFSMEGLFGNCSDGVDEKASAAEFMRLLDERLHREYPNTEIVVSHGNNDFHKFDGRQDSDEAIVLGEVVHDVWESFEWVVDASD